MKKGFTLIELLGVIVILGIIGVLVTPLIMNVVNQSKTDVTNAQISTIKKAARNYTAKHVYDLNCDTVCKVSIDTLIKEGFLEDKDLKNANDDSSISKTETVEITWDGTKYTYKYPVK